VADAPARERYEATAGDALAGIAVYRRHADEVTFVHTEVLVERRGVGGALARGALEDVRARGLRAVPMCPFIAAWIRRHPDYADLVPASAAHMLDATGGGGAR
jgi:predicted GNAT family acetyltransferase